MNSLKKLLLILKTLGWRWALFRVWYVFLKKSGFLRWRTPLKSWEKFPSEFAENSAEPLFIRNLLVEFGDKQNEAKKNALFEAREIVAGRFILFGIHRRQLDRFPQWNKSPLDGKIAPDSKHWSGLNDFDYGDIKNIWELNRWPWAFTLAAGAENCVDENEKERFAERFWELAENWFTENPPNAGVNWRCGQEASFRLFASIYARITFAGATATTPARLQAWHRFVFATGERIAGNLFYALSQKNNHGISECVGLLTGALLAGGEKGKNWFNIATENLEKQLAELVYPDGGFSQHSAVYHRVALHDLLWAENLFLAQKQTPPVWLSNAREKLTVFFEELSDKNTGDFFHYGANDGSNILPFAEPFFITKKHEERDAAGIQHFPDAGVCVLRRGELEVLFRCPTRFLHRPSHADLLHISARFRGREFLLSPGSFSYNPPPAEDDPRFAAGNLLPTAFCHNTATLEGHDQMQKISRFLYAPWATGVAENKSLPTPEEKNIYQAAFDGGEPPPAVRFLGEHYGYLRQFGAVHRREITLLANAGEFVVEDFFVCPTPRRWRLHWLLADGEFTPHTAGGDIRLPATGDFPELNCEMRCDIALKKTKATGNVSYNISHVRAAGDSIRGWHSPNYQELRPANSLALELPPATIAGIRTFFRLAN